MVKTNDSSKSAKNKLQKVTIPCPVDVDGAGDVTFYYHESLTGEIIMKRKLHDVKCKGVSNFKILVEITEACALDGSDNAMKEWVFNNRSGELGVGILVGEIAAFIAFIVRVQLIRKAELELKKLWEYPGQELLSQPEARNLLLSLKVKS